jgi:hypothetical protein
MKAKGSHKKKPETHCYRPLLRRSRLILHGTTLASGKKLGEAQIAVMGGESKEKTLSGAWDRLTRAR